MIDVRTARLKIQRRTLVRTGYATVAFLIILTITLRFRVNRDHEWISRVSDSATWASLCESQGAEEVVICPPYSDPAKYVKGRSLLNWFMIPMHPTVNDDQFFVVLLNGRGRIVRNAIINPNEIRKIDENSGRSEEPRGTKWPRIRRPFDEE